ncbi:RHS repeat-associated core domain-containing protein, partial [Chryseobacterium sp.]|uniref:RHS repeat-associated core domain-containing protein n=1 Tax=Chryseobacterium sp. TaxID=1871047 RepID=UPI002FCBA2A9
TEYLDGFQYETESIGGRPAPPTPKFVPTAEGYYNFENNKYIYNYTDHLGNVRLSYFNNGNGAEVLEENNYYPFGLKHEGYNGTAGNASYEYKYNGKELQETGMYDYGARFYMPDIGGWGVVDPLAETSRRWNPYNYAYNNPIRFIDPDGRQGTDWFNNSLGNMEFRDDIKSQKDLDDKGIAGSYVGESSQQGDTLYAADGNIYNDSANGGGKPIGFGRVTDIETVEMVPQSVIEKRNLSAARQHLYEAIDNYWGGHAFGFTIGGTLGTATGSLTLAQNFGDGKVRLFGTYGAKLGTPSFGIGLQLNQMNAFGELPNGQKFTDVFGGMEGESSAVSGSYVVGGEISRSAKNGIPTDYGTITRSVNVGVGYDIGVSSTQTVNLNQNWFKRNIGYRPQVD